MKAEVKEQTQTQRFVIVTLTYEEALAAVETGNALPIIDAIDIALIPCEEETDVPF